MALGVIVVSGVSGAGKSTVGALLAQRLSAPFVEGDDLHPAANVAKMARGEPLDDVDREPWLSAVAAWIQDRLARSESGVISCSALRRQHRDRLRDPGVCFVHLAPPRAVIEARLTARRGHFMPADLLPSQFAALEPLEADEEGLTVRSTAAPGRVVDEIERELSTRGVR